MKIESPVDTFERLPLVIQYEENAQYREVYGFSGRANMISLEGQLLRQKNAPSETVVLFMHPSSSLTLLPLPAKLAEAGIHVICGGSRYLRNDTSLIMEKVLLDMGAYIQYAREILRYKKVVLAGWSGGASLSSFYQSQAEHPTIQTTPAGDPVDIASAALPPADGLMMIACHLSRAETLTEWLDPSVTDETQPDKREPALDIYAESSDHLPPYSSEFLLHYRAAQKERNKRISDWCLQQLEALKKGNTGELERSFITHRTMADPRWLDPQVDPNDRTPGVCYLGVPKVVNMGPVGLARFSTLRSWLSQWSLEYSNAKTELSAPHISVPALVIENTADDAAPASHPRTIFNLLGSKDKTFKAIKGATHYYQGQPEKLQEARSRISEWLISKKLL